MKWVEHVAHMGTMQYKMFENLKERNCLVDLGTDWMILKMDFREMVLGCGLELSGSEQGVMACLQIW